MVDMTYPTYPAEFFQIVPGVMAVVVDGDEHEHDGTFYLERVEEDRMQITLHENLEPALDANLDVACIRTPEGWGDFEPLLELVRANLTEHLRERGLDSEVRVALSDHDDAFTPALALTILPTRRPVATNPVYVVAEFRSHMTAVMDAILDLSIYRPRG